MAREASLEEIGNAYAEAKGWSQRKTVYAGVRGAPDRHYYRWKFVLLVEWKRPGETPSAIQQKEHERLSRSGTQVHVIDNLDEFKRLIDRHNVLIEDCIRALRSQP